MDRDRIILEGIVGSTAYGLAHADSDEDRLGIFQAPTRAFLGLTPVQQTHVTKDPDTTYHELGKFIGLALKANPSILELLFLEDYTVMSGSGLRLIAERQRFLSRRIYQSYGGYAKSQLKRIKERGDSFGSDTKNRTAKHARHLLRLLHQGRQLLETGALAVRVDNPDELFAIGRLPVPEMIQRFEEEFVRFDATPTALPAAPDTAFFEEYLIEQRLADAR